MHPPLICFAIIYEGEGKVRTENGKLLDFHHADKFSLMKVLITVTQTDHPHRMKVWVEPFQRLAGRGQSPRRLRRGETFHTAFLWFFLWPTFPKKERNESGSVTLRKSSPFFLAKLPQKEPKTASYGALPRTPPPFEKGGRKLSSERAWPFG